MENIEEIMLEDGAELELIVKVRSGIDSKTPLVHLGNMAMTFNKKAAEITPRRIKWYTTEEYVVGLPATEKDRNGYVTWELSGTLMAHFPSGIRRDKKVKNGVYKIYKYKNGIAFKRYEQYKTDGEVEA